MAALLSDSKDLSGLLRLHAIGFQFLAPPVISVQIRILFSHPISGSQDLVLRSRTGLACCLNKKTRTVITHNFCYVQPKQPELNHITFFFNMQVLGKLNQRGSKHVMVTE